MSKIKVVHYTKNLTYAGTDRVAQTICKYLDKDKYDVYMLYRDCGQLERQEYVEQILGKDKVIPHHYEFGENISPYWPKKDNFVDVLQKINPDIIHFHRSGYEEWPCLPFLKESFPNTKFIEHHIFDQMDSFSWDSYIFICDYIRKKCNYILGPLDVVINNPVEKPFKMREFKAKKTVILGRIGRPDNFYAISLYAIKELVNRGIKNFKYLIVNPCDAWRKKVEELKLQDYCVFIDPIYSDEELQEFYDEIDIMAHSRSDGEVNSTVISESQINGVPIVTHYSLGYNGQAEQVANGRGFIVNWEDYKSYAAILYMLINDPVKRNLIGQKVQEWALKNIEASVIVKKIEDVYERVMNA